MSKRFYHTIEAILALKKHTNKMRDSHENKDDIIHCRRFWNESYCSL